MRKNLINLLLKIEEFKISVFSKFFPKKKIVLTGNFAGKNKKTYLTGSDSLFIDGKISMKVLDIRNEAKSVLKDAINNPEIMLNFVQSKNTPVIRAPHIEKILFLLGEQEGFLIPVRGINALILILAINILSETKLPVGFKTPAMFVFQNKPLNIYILSHQFHHWLAYINELPGYDEKTIRNFKNVWDSECLSKDVSKMTIDEIVSLKDAIKRDFEAIKLVKDMAREFVGQKEALTRIKNGENTNI